MSINSGSAEAPKQALGADGAAVRSTNEAVLPAIAGETTPTGTQSLRDIGRRRLIFGLLVTATMIGLGGWLAQILAYDGFSLLDVLLLVCFLVYLPWIAVGFWNSVIGVAVLYFVKDPMQRIVPPIGKARADDPVFVRVAVLMTIRNEDPARAFARLKIVKQSLDRTGQGGNFDYFILSDSSRPDIFPLEEQAAEEWRSEFDNPARLVYRRRDNNEGYKAGNVRDFCQRWGNNYELMIPLDADSLMTGETILQMVRIHQANPRLGILQSLIVGLPTTSFFARVFQFGMRHGMRAYTTGSAWWHAECGPFWGHNTTIRIQPFYDYCKLPLLPGKPPLGGHVLSHDHIEAVMMRRAGYEVRVIPEECGSYEENPPTLLDFEARDVRWANGNLQYLKLLDMPGVLPTSWMQILMSIQMFIGQATLVLFAVLAAVAAAVAPVGGAFPAGSALVFYIVFILMYLAPRLLGVLDGAIRSAERYGGALRLFAGAYLDTLFTLFLAPLQLFAATYFMVSAVFGRNTKWDGQKRDGYRVPWKSAARAFWPHTLFGAALLGFVLLTAPGAALWFIPFVLGLILAIPFAVVTSLPRLSAWADRWKVCGIPEEFDMPDEVRAVQAPLAATS